VEKTAKTVPLVYYPGSLGEALSLLAANPRALVVAGGTSFFSFPHRPHMLFDRIVISLERVDELQKIHIRDRWADLGPAINLGQLLRSGKIFLPPLLKTGIQQIGHYTLRNQATLGGNLGLTPFHGDLVPILLVLGAQIEIRSFRNSQWIEMRQWSAGDPPLKEPRTIITRIRIPLINNNFSFYQKFGHFYSPSGQRGSLAALASIQKNIITHFHMAIASPESKVIRNRNWEAILTGQKIPLTSKTYQMVESLLREEFDQQNELSPFQKQQFWILTRRVMDLLSHTITTMD